MPPCRSRPSTVPPRQPPPRSPAPCSAPGSTCCWPSASSSAWSSGAPLLLTGCGVAAAGFAVFWAAATLPLAGAGLLLAGLGVALLYPTTVSRVVAAWPQAPDRAAARAALASGLAIGGAPYLLARLADGVGLRQAYLVVPVLLLALAARAVTDRGRAATTP